MPPKDIEPAALWLKVIARPRPHELVDFPRLDENGKPLGQIAIRVLTQEEQANAAAEALKTTRRKMGEDSTKPVPGEDGDAFQNVYGNIAACEVLQRACRNPEDLERPFFPSSGEMRKHLSVDEIGVLMASYHEVQARLGPIMATMTDDEYKAWVETLAKGAAVFPLARLSWPERTALMRRLACDLWTSWTSSSSPSSPPSEPSSESPESSE